MPTLARIVTLLGLILIVVGAVLLGKDIIDINQLHAVASANRSNNFFNNPVYNVIWTSVAALLGGLLAGIGLGMMRRRGTTLPR